jgi:hypothetical protein
LAVDKGLERFVGVVVVLIEGEQVGEQLRDFVGGEDGLEGTTEGSFTCADEDFVILVCV